MFGLVLALLLASPPPEDPLAQVSAALEREDFQAAAPLLEELLGEHPEEANLQFQLAYVYTRLERGSEAADRYRKALELDPSMAPARLNLALLLLESDQADEAIVQLEKLLELRPDDSHAVRLLGHSLMRTQQLDRAVPYLEKAVEQDPQPQAYAELARALMELKRFDAASEQLEKAAAADPRLASIALDVEVIELTVVDPAGDRVPNAFALLASGGHVERQDAGEASLAVLAPREPAPGAFLAVGAPGRVPRRLEPPFKSRTVVLEGALEIAPSPAARFEADTGAYGYWLRLRRTDAPTGLEQLDAVELDFAWASGDPRTIALPGPGRYELDVLVRMRMGSRFGYSPHDRWQRTGVLVDVSRADGPFTLELPDDIERYSKTM